MTMKTIVRAGLIAAALLAAPLAAQAQMSQAQMSQAQMSQAPANAVSSFDAYRAAAITAGVIVGATVAVIVTEGLIIPAYAYVTGAGTTAATGSAAGAATAGTMATTSGTSAAGAGHGYAFVHGAARLFGAISGGIIGDNWYMSR
jgi:hypothetical protein